MAKKRKAAEISIDINANVAQLSKDMNKAVGELDKLQRKVGGIQKILAASFTLDLGRTLLPAFQQLAGILGDLSKRGEQLSGVADAFNRLGGSSEQIAKAKDALLGTVGSVDLMKLANEGLIKQIPGIADNFAKIAELGGRVASALGIDAKDAVNRLIDALAKGNVTQLQALKVNIDAEKAYADYAKAIGTTTEKLSEAQKKEAVQLKFYENLQSTLDALPAAADSVRNAQDAVNIAFQEGLAQIGAVINNNDELKKAYRELANTLDDVDWVSLGTSASQFFTTVLGAASAALPTIIKWVEDTNRGFQYLFGQGIQAQADRSRKKIQELQGELKNLTDPFRGGTMENLWNPNKLGARQEQRKKQLDAQLEAETDNFKRLNDQLQDNNDKAAAAAVSASTLTVKVEGLNQVVVPAIKNTEMSTAAIDSQAKAADRAARQIEKYRASWNKFKTDAATSDLERRFNEFTSEFTHLDLAKLQAQLSETVEKGFIEKWQTEIDSGAISLEEVQKEAQKVVSDMAADMQRKLTKSFSGATKALMNGLSNVSSNFGLELTDLFSTLQEGLGDNLDKMMADIGAALDMSAKELEFYTKAAFTVIGAGLSSKRVSKENKSEKGTGEAVGSGAGAIGGGVIGFALGGPVGAAIGAYIGAEVGKVLGGLVGDQFKWGPQNADSKARHVFANWLEEQLSSLKSVTLKMQNGQWNTFQGDLMNFIEGDTARFNKPGWADEMSKWGEDARSLFEGLGTALQGLLGITEDVGGQIAYLLGTNLAGDIDSARMLVYQLGLSFEDLSEALLKMALQGQITWQQYAANVAGLGKAFEPGLEGMANMKGAVDQLFASGGRGRGAILAFKNIIVEAIEGGAKTVDDLKQHLINGGMSVEDAEKVVAVIKASGVKSLEEFKNMSDAQFGGIIAGIGNSVDAINNKWKELGKDLDKIKYDMDNLPTEKDIKIRFSAEFDENMEKARNAGLLDVGNSRLGTVTPPTDTKAMNVSKAQVNGASVTAMSSPNTMKSSQVNIAIDARGADPGVEQRIYDVVNSYSDVIARQAANIVIDNQSRGA
jgi:hypothetical protein